MPRGFSVYLPGGAKSPLAQSTARDDPHRAHKLTKPREGEPPVLQHVYAPEHDMMQRQSALYQDGYLSTNSSSGAPDAPTYPFPSSGATYSSPTYAPPHYPYTLASSPYDSIYSAQGRNSSGEPHRPMLRRGEPYDEVFEPHFPYPEQDPYSAYSQPPPADYGRQRRPSLSRTTSSYGQAPAGLDAAHTGAQAFAPPERPITRRSSDRWAQHEDAPHQYAIPRPHPVRGDSGASWGGTRESGLFQRLSNDGMSYRSGSPPSDPGFRAASPSSTDSDFSMPRTPSPLAPLVIPSVSTPGSLRSVRWDDNLVAPSPVFPMRRKGWFCRRGDQLWTNSGAYRPPKQGEEYPQDLDEYPDFGAGWMNEEGVRIDMQHCLVPKIPLRSALKRRESNS